MSFDSHSLERLRELGRKLPKSLPTPSKPNQAPSSNLHPIETESNPKKLFEELIKASPDGKIPSHLIDRLKEAEYFDLEKQSHNKKHTLLESSSQSSSKNKTKSEAKYDNENNDMYISFKRLLLEEED
ncbi:MULTISPECIES: hypothetical protein [Prochlorococcus]|uniref:Uncharacterized protein n=1 Tax=Prochlorococcus marinus (strain SARG / CCMP1375 / SS120) TaxID=167539 RepID=Q7VCH8_PROMA|nr:MULTISPECIES: hypothetical protein [Prochlorococcus]AAP99806.1 Predicted protein [Prochlorococcus marinus subsp. marinus str. CCMP1375]KGG11848.1 hypothetical protein EV04_0873 [Prochlorococcus marinus str. LG]KGG21845.1 hypothetical protein EV08_0450 [Prochlorococcus marinus str. SS2]KGG23724.1 hypothetical protein EV09_1349 [Prochlorococcus marinus str. SS35]KGG32040.1 hypothetical protein EV10_1154 [Prochlorococcus marinus str. SS51]